MNKVSAVLIAIDEEARIRKCLDALKWCDEIIVVVDSRTQDKTAQLARMYTDKVFIQEWLGYGDQKNYAISKASNEWVLSIDVDEVVPKPLGDEIVSVLKDPKHDGYYINFNTYVGDKHIRYGGMQKDWHLRLYKRSQGVFGGNFGGQVHESVNVINSGYLINKIDHYSYSNWGEYRNKVLKYSQIEAESYVNSGLKLSLGHRLKPFLRFVKIFVFQLGFLDGVTGIKHALLLSYYAWRRNKLIIDMMKKR